ncbi:trypsin-like peptidase domain-containing protein [Ascidiimonas sp. W6]|uniref:trypsin-like peptidase domain-containing protein n=1 Tax=Ascidiimonas meishanensis TaxID=3128903 RepID=UPI0030ED28E4
MKKFLGLLFVSFLGGVIAIGSYKLFLEKKVMVIENTTTKPEVVTTNYNPISAVAVTDTNFVDAAEKTVNAVVHVKNLSITRAPSSLLDFFYGSGAGTERAQVGTGSGVIISPDGYIVTNNHVIINSSQLQITLNNNRTYEAELVGADPNTDIALLKIEAQNDLPYLAFGDSDNTKIGEWVLAVGNPFNLTSTVTAGIISAKARDLNEGDNKNQSFLQTDAAVNPGNSGGALVNTNGDLIGINTAISSQTGSYVGYSFAVPSNIAKKVVDDILEFGMVQEGVLGVQGQQLNTRLSQELGIDDTEGFYITGVEEGSGAANSGVRSGDIIKMIDKVKISKFSNLSGYLKSKRPNEEVSLNVKRSGKTKIIKVKLLKNETYQIKNLGLKVKNLSKEEKKQFNTERGVKIMAASELLKNYNLSGQILLEVNGEDIYSINDAKSVDDYLQQYRKRPNILVLNRKGEKERLIFQ